MSLFVAHFDQITSLTCHPYQTAVGQPLIPQPTGPGNRGWPNGQLPKRIVSQWPENEK